METINWQTVLLAVVAGLFAAIPPSIAAWRTGNISRLAARQQYAFAVDAKNVLAESTTKVDSKLEKLTQTTNSVHTLVNSNMGEQMLIAAVALRRISEMSGDPKDAKIAEVAEQLYDEHQTKQGILDSVTQ